VALLEQVGTRLGCWHWPGVLLGKFAAVPSGNPPSGIASFYFGLDVLCLLLYLRARPAAGARHRRRAAYAASLSRHEDQMASVATMALASTTGRAPMARP